MSNAIIHTPYIIHYHGNEKERHLDFSQGTIDCVICINTRRLLGLDDLPGEVVP